MEVTDKKLLGKPKGKMRQLDSYKQAKFSEDKINKTRTFLSKCIFSKLMSLIGANIT